MKDRVFRFFSKNKWVVLFALLFFSCCFVFIAFQKKPGESIEIKEEKPNIQLTLFGSKTITLNQGEEYIEPGYYAVDEKGNLLTDLVVVNSNLDINKPGIYEISYQIKEMIKTRVVEVLEKTSLNTKTLSLSLKGENVIHLSLNDTYKELGYIATFEKLDITDQVVVSGNVNTTKAGMYAIHYTIEYQNLKKEVTRTVIVSDDSLILSLSYTPTKYTNTSVSISVNVSGNHFSSLVLPNKVVVKERKTTYQVSNNGTYTFLAYNQEGKYFSKTITINNIDTKAPNGSCTATIYPTKTDIQVLALDNLSGIKNYIYLDNGKEIARDINPIFHNGRKTSKNISVKVYDKANNYSIFTCKITDHSALDPIQPSQGESIVKKSETDTLKVYITKKSDYYITRIWAYDPYHQLNKQDSPEYGSNLYRPKKLLEVARDNNQLNNKLMIGFNASGFYLKDTYDASSVSKYAKYNKTSVGTLVITNGKVIRNAYDKAYKTWYIAGIDKNNQLRIFTDKKASTTDQITAKKTWANEVIHSGIKNTFTFASPLVLNGVKSSVTTSMPSITSKVNRQAICQVNANNFVLITGANLNREDLINSMLNLHCQTGTNLDGGGSIALLYKEKNTNTIETIIGNNRSLTEVAYFTE